jgi:hypothetical protein
MIEFYDISIPNIVTATKTSGLENGDSKQLSEKSIAKNPNPINPIPLMTFNLYFYIYESLLLNEYFI